MPSALFLWWGWCAPWRSGSGAGRTAALDLPVLLRAAGFCLLPVWLTGGIHLDGYADTCDALASYGDRISVWPSSRTPTAGPLR